MTILQSLLSGDGTRLAEELAVPDVVVGAVQHLVAHGALEAALVPLEAAGQLLLRSVNRLQTDTAVIGHLSVFLNDHFES